MRINEYETIALPASRVRACGWARRVREEQRGEEWYHADGGGNAHRRSRQPNHRSDTDGNTVVGNTDANWRSDRSYTDTDC